MKNLKKSLRYSLYLVLVICIFCVTTSAQDSSLIDTVNINYIAFGGDLELMKFEPTTVISFVFDTGWFEFDARGDSLIFRSNMPINEAGRHFVNYCDQYWSTRVDSLINELDLIRKKYCY